LADGKEKADGPRGSSLPMVWDLIRQHRAVMALGALLLMINRAAGLVVPYAPKILLDRIIAKREVHLLGPLVGALTVAAVIQAISTYGLTQLLARAGQSLTAEMRCKVQSHMMALPTSFYDANKTGALLSRIMNDVGGIRNVIGPGFIDFAGGLVTALFVLIILWRISPLMTAVTCVFLLVLTLILRSSFAIMRPLFIEGAKLGAEVSARLNESLNGIRVIKGYHAEERERQVFALGVQRILLNGMRTLKTTSRMGLTSTMFMRILSALLLLIAAKQILKHQMTPGDLFSYTMYLGYLVTPIMQIGTLGTQFTEILAGLDRTREVLNEPREDEDSQRTIALDQVEGRIRFEQVCFEYETGKPVLTDISFEACPNSVTALVGSSGSGKSTIIGLVAAFYKATSGNVYIDGTDLSCVRLDSYRPKLGIVLQESFLFAGTIWDNVRFGRPGATREEVIDACRISHVDEFAGRFKDKYETVIGERGVKLSGGQRQRISIARAILADPRILILDEATSSLDSESEAFIQQGLKYLMKGRTTFVIAHRLSTIRNADQILIVEAGEIVERGTHVSLYAHRGRYFDLYTRQHGLESNLLLDPEGEVQKSDQQPELTVRGLSSLCAKPVVVAGDCSIAGAANEDNFGNGVHDLTVSEELGDQPGKR